MSEVLPDVEQQITAFSAACMRVMKEPTLSKCVEMFKRYIRGAGRLEWEKVVPLGPHTKGFVQHEELSALDAARTSELFRRVAVLKLNGGLGTTMGCNGAKSCMKLNNRTGADVPLVLMNSFNTQAEAERTVAKFSNLRVIQFNQSQFPRIRRDTMLPLPTSPTDGPENWYPPGHGDVLAGLRESGVLDRLLSEGRTHIFISNSDNLGATLDTRLYNNPSALHGLAPMARLDLSMEILNYMIEHENDILMELTPKTPADVKGGTVVEYEGHMRLLEAAQVPPDKVNEFKTVRKFGVFNTNNIWFDLRFVKTALERGELQLDIIANPKKVREIPVLQLETAVGSSISCAHNPAVVCVPRSRFLPVKSVADMLTIQSNLYVLSPETGALVMNPARNFPVAPTVSLGSCIQKVSDLAAHFVAVPDMLELDSLTIYGEVYFGARCCLKGNVTIVCPPGGRIDLPAGTVLDNKIVSGSLVIAERV